jgi:hypothetical protein
MRQLSFYGRIVKNVFKMKVALIAGHQWQHFKNHPQIGSGMREYASTRNME